MKINSCENFKWNFYESFLIIKKIYFYIVILQKFVLFFNRKEQKRVIWNRKFVEINFTVHIEEVSYYKA